MSIPAACLILSGRVLRTAEPDRLSTLRSKKEPEKAVPLTFRRPPGGDGPPWSLLWRRDGRGGGPLEDMM